MARISFKGQSDYFRKLQELERHYAKDTSLERAVAAGAKPVADAIRRNLEAMSIDGFQRLPKGMKFSGLSKEQREDLEKGFGLTPISRDRRGFVHTKAGFNGYGRFPTPNYPNGVPNALLAAATESGSSVRQKTPFIRPAVNKTSKQSIEAMGAVIDEDMKKIFEGG